jgi:hypothetical protein
LQLLVEGRKANALLGALAMNLNRKGDETMSMVALRDGATSGTIGGGRQ